MRTIIQIGHHKTATTSIQHYLQKFRNDYIMQGLYVPDSLLGKSNPNHFMLSVFALAENRYSTKKIKLKEKKGQKFFLELPQTLEASISEHYKKAKLLNCESVLWSNEGLYLLNSVEEYSKLRNLILKFSNEIVCVCCFRDSVSFRGSYKKQLQKKGLRLSKNKDSYRYLEKDSWLFDYDRKKAILNKVFDEKTTFFDYQKKDMIAKFISKIGYLKIDDSDLRLNITGM